jgi:hypothetical protein
MQIEKVAESVCYITRASSVDVRDTERAGSLKIETNGDVQMQTSISKGDRVRFVRADGTLSEDAVKVHEVWDGKDAASNFSFISGGVEQPYHLDLVHRDGDDSPVTVPTVETWFIAIGNAGGWGRARTEKQAIANMKRQGGKPDQHVVYRVNQWTKVRDTGGLTWPGDYGDPVEVARKD